MTPRLLVIQHEDTCPAGLLGEVFNASGVLLDVRCGHRGDQIPRSLEQHDAVMVLGGAMGANDDARFPWLTDTKALLRHSAFSGHPVLGVCLGHQLLNTALGGTTGVNVAGKARGLTPVTPTALGRQDELLATAAPGALGLQWNDDVVTRLAPEAVVLATAPDGSVQAARFAPRAWGVQFHPEATPEIFRSWAVHRPAGADPHWQDEALHAAADEFVRRREQVSDAWRPFARRFASIIHGASHGQSRTSMLSARG